MQCRTQCGAVSALYCVKNIKILSHAIACGYKQPYILNQITENLGPEQKLADIPDK